MGGTPAPPILAAPALARRAPRRRGGWALLLGSALTLAAVAGLSGAGEGKEYLRALVLAGQPRPDATGPYRVGSATLRVDAGFPGGHDVPVALYFPAAPRPSGAGWNLAGLVERLAHPTRARSRPGAPPAGSEARFPLLVYFPSWFSGRYENSFTLANLASLGFVVASIDDIARLPALPDIRGTLQRAAIDASSEEDFTASRALAGRRADLEAAVGSAVVSHMLGAADWAPRIDAGRIGAIGFSFGGAAAAAMSAADPRIRAVVNLDGSLFGPVAETGLAVPFLTLFAGDSCPTPQDLVQPDLAARFEAILDRDSIAQQAVQDTRPDSWTLVVDRTTHLDFSDRLAMPAFIDRRGPGDIDRMGTWADINGVVSGFLDVFLRDAPKAGFPGLPDAGRLRTLEAMRRGPWAVSAEPSGPDR